MDSIIIIIIIIIILCFIRNKLIFRQLSKCELLKNSFIYGLCLIKWNRNTEQSIWVPQY